MADTFIHLTSVEQLAMDPRIHTELASLLDGELDLGKMGGIFIDLPYFETFYRSAFSHLLGMEQKIIPWARTFHCHKPTQLGLAFAEVAHTDIEFAKETWPIAFVCGYFSHMAFDRVIHALVERLVRENIKPGEDYGNLHAKIERIQSLLFHRELYGRNLLGTGHVKELARIDSAQSGQRQHSILNFIRKSCLKGLGFSPSEKELKKWLRGYHRYARLVSMPFMTWFQLKDEEKIQKWTHIVFRNDFFDFVDQYNRAIDFSVEYILTVYEYMKNGDFSLEAREEFLEIVPELDLVNPPDEEFLYEDQKREFSLIDEEAKENVFPFIDPKEH